MNERKNVLVLTGSPRKNRNSALLADAFIRGAREAAHEVIRFDAGFKKIKGCIACQRCYTDGKACIFNDDFNELAPLAENAELLVLVTPLYWFTFPAQIKAAIDKMYALYVGKWEIKIRETMLLVCAETGDPVDFEGIVRSYELIGRYLKWEDKGQLLISHVHEKGDILKTDALEKALRWRRELRQYRMGKLWNPWHGCHKLSEGCRHCYVYRGDAKRGVDSSQVVRTKSFDLPARKKRNGDYTLPPGSEVFTCFTSDFFCGRGRPLAGRSLGDDAPADRSGFSVDHQTD